MPGSLGRRGMTLLEIIVALVLLAIAALSATAFFTRVFNAAQTAENAKVARDSMSLLLTIMANDWDRQIVWSAADLPAPDAFHTASNSVFTTTGHSTCPNNIATAPCNNLVLYQRASSPARLITITYYTVCVAQPGSYSSVISLPTLHSALTCTGATPIPQVIRIKHDPSLGDSTTIFPAHSQALAMSACVKESVNCPGGPPVIQAMVVNVWGIYRNGRDSQITTTLERSFPVQVHSSGVEILPP